MFSWIKEYLKKITKQQYLYFWGIGFFIIVSIIVLLFFKWKKENNIDNEINNKLIWSEFFEKKEEDLKNKYVFRVEKVSEVLWTNESILEMRDEVGIANTLWIVRLYTSPAMEKIRNERLAMYKEEVNKFCSEKNSYKDIKEKDRINFYKKIKDLFDNRYFLKIELGNNLYQTFKYDCSIPSIHTRQMLFREAILYAYDVINFEVLRQKDVLDTLIKTWKTTIQPRMMWNIIYKEEDANINLDWQFFQDKCVFNLEKENIQKIQKENYAKTFTELNSKIVENEEKKFNEQLEFLKKENPNKNIEELKKEIWWQDIGLSSFSEWNKIIPMTVASLKDTKWNIIEENKCKEMAKKVVSWYMAVPKEKTITQIEIKNFITAINKNPQLLLFIWYKITNNKYVPINYLADIHFLTWNETNEEMLFKNNPIEEQVIDEKRYRAIQDGKILDKVVKKEQEFKWFPIETEIGALPEKK